MSAAGAGHGAGHLGGVVTPEAVALSLPTATVGTRALAVLIDQLIIGTGLTVLALAQLALGVGGFVPGWLALAILLVLSFSLQFGYPIGFETLLRGRTPGKLALGLRVVTVEGGPIRLRHAAIRAMVGVVELLGTLGAVAVITSLSTRRGQRLGDLAAGTVVIRERSGAGRDATQAEVFAVPPGTEDLVARLDVSGLGPNGYATVRETLRRLRSLPPAAAQQVAAEVAAGLAGRVRPDRPDDLPPAVWLGCIAAAVQARRPATVPGAASVPMTAQGPLTGRPGSGPSAPGPSAAAPSPQPPSPQPASPQPQPRIAEGGFVPPA